MTFGKENFPKRHTPKMKMGATRVAARPRDSLRSLVTDSRHDSVTLSGQGWPSDSGRTVSAAQAVTVPNSESARRTRRHPPLAARCGRRSRTGTGTLAL